MRESGVNRPAVIENADLDSISRYFRDWQAELIHLGRGPVACSVVSIPVAATRMASLGVDRPTVLRGVAPLERWSLIATSPASPPVRTAARPIGSGECVILASAEPFEIYLPARCSAFMMSCVAEPGERPTGFHAPANQHAALLSRCMDLLDGVRRAAVPEMTILQVHQRVRDLLPQMADLFVQATALPSDSTPRVLRRRAVLRACTYINENLAKPISLDDLCQYSGVRARTLEYGFREFYDVGPTTYLRSVRLCRVRRDLLRVRRAGETIARAARRWHFSHMGQFSRDYRLLFGESPSTTRTRANPSPPVTVPCAAEATA